MSVHPVESINLPPLFGSCASSFRWYRCPELLLAPNRPYNEAIDMWAVGCILAELLRRKPLFPGKSHANQVQLIFEVIGYSVSQNLGFEVQRVTMLLS